MASSKESASYKTTWFHATTKTKKGKFCWAKRKTCPNLNFPNFFFFFCGRCQSWIKNRGRKKGKKKLRLEMLYLCSSCLMATVILLVFSSSRAIISFFSCKLSSEPYLEKHKSYSGFDFLTLNICKFCIPFCYGTLALKWAELIYRLKYSYDIKQ